MQREENSCTIILGVHRSGVSILGGALHILGVNLGKAFIDAPTGSTTGTFLNQDIILAHDILLRNLGRSWDMVGSLPVGWQESDAAKQSKDTLIRILEAQYLDQGPFVINDPRMCRLMPLWMPLLQNLSITPKLILLVRHPLEVALSLRAHAGFELRKGHLLWQNSYREALAACQNENHIVVSFEQLLDDTLPTIRRITDFISFPRLQEPQITQVLHFVSPDLKQYNQADASEIENQQFSQYAWNYDQIVQQTVCQVIQKANDNAMANSPIAKKFEFIPIPLPNFEQTFNSKSADISTVKIFSDLLSEISDHEDLTRRYTLEKNRRLLASTSISETLYLEVFFPTGLPESPYLTDQSKKILLAPEEWQEVHIDVPRPEFLRTCRLRLDPLNTRGMASISTLKLTDHITGEACWTAQDNLSQCSLEHDGFVLSSQDTLEMACTGNDPQLFLPLLPDLPDRPLRLEIWIKVSRRQVAIAHKFEKLEAELKESQASASQLETELKESQASASQLETELKESQASASQLETERKHFENSYLTQEALTKEYFSLLTRAEQENEKQYNSMKTQKALAQKELATQKALAQKELATQKALAQKELATQKALAQKADSNFKRQTQETAKRLEVIQGMVHQLSNRTVSRKVRKQQKKTIVLLRNSPLFDVEYYKARYPEVVKSGIDPVTHYVLHGWTEFRWPNECFDTFYYLSNHKDVLSAKLNPLVHFIKFGWKEGRNPSKLFNIKKYFENNPDVASSGINPLSHYLQYGKAEGRRL